MSATGPDERVGDLDVEAIEIERTTLTGSDRASVKPRVYDRSRVENPNGQSTRHPSAF